VHWEVYIPAALGAYLLGSIPTGYLVAKARGIDIRAVGSGNIGATNVFRILGKGPGIFVLLVDALKGFAAVHFLPSLLLGTPTCCFGHPLHPPSALVAGIAAILGHNYTCWLKFKGGKGIATTAGVFLALTPIGLGLTFAVWLIVFALSRYVSLASIAAAAALPCAIWFEQHHQRQENPALLLVSILLGALAIWKHKANIQRLLAGTESRVGQKTPSAQILSTEPQRVTVLGAGAWGTALAKLLAENGHTVMLWGHDAARLSAIREMRRNERLPGVELPGSLCFESDLPRAIENAQAIVVAVPSQSLRSVTARLSPFGGLVISVTKGIEFDTGLTMSGVLAHTMPRARVAALSGPSFAMEVARGTPTAAVVAAPDPATARAAQALFHRPTFRVYSSTDLRGVELGGALKNVAGIAAGVCDGLGLGDNSKAALVTRAVAEMRRLGLACGAQAETFSGLSGLGDLTATCFSRLSRNRALGEQLGRGEILSQTAGRPLAEGHPTARSAHQLAQRLGVETPIISAVYAMLYEGKPPAQAVRDLLTRESKAED
jgi:glycerol-3-phosphate dehydrogenase (NAD(P)+)